MGTFYLADRGRDFLSGMTITPKYIGVKDITNVLEAHPVYIDRSILDPCIFAIDSIYMQDAINHSKSKSETK